MSAVPSVLVTEREYLTNPVYEHAEFVDGVIVERFVGKKKHAQIQLQCGALLLTFKSAQIFVGTELHCRLEVRGKTVYRIPDVAATRNGVFNEDQVLVGGPTLAVEVQSPGDSVANLIRKAQDYFLNGSQIVWIVLPDEESVLVLEPNQTPSAFTKGQMLTAVPLSPDLQIPVDSLFL